MFTLSYSTKYYHIFLISNCTNLQVFTTHECYDKSPSTGAWLPVEPS